MLGGPGRPVGSRNKASLALDKIADDAGEDSLPLPVIKTAADVVTALGTVADLVGAGEMTPDEGAALAAIFESKRQAIEKKCFAICSGHY